MASATVPLPPPPPPAQKNGAVTEGPDLSVTVNGLKLPNPFVIASGPPGTNYTVMKRAFDDGWGGVIAKTVSLDSSKVINVTPRYSKLYAPGAKSGKDAVIGWENIELISDRPLETMLEEFKRLKEEYPDRVLIASIMEEVNKGAWEEIVGRCEETGVDAFEINFRCCSGGSGVMWAGGWESERECGWVGMWVGRWVGGWVGGWVDGWVGGWAGVCARVRACVRVRVCAAV